ncbi:organomercurial lyase [Sulfurirhabdus autotrophica]|uniref:Alkylmercury lyase-like protein n=1 Tax=Sulfurirhabdus autotrophica TaxID=1706046 RepID=A0A4R3XVP9_9PROT|nr:organomercurial lyase [Sulfurirhabdus autotrophica]TCV82881.1 alkylmercury lyase-like protein [Sulfurirhabdus autotrophica]
MTSKNNIFKNVKRLRREFPLQERIEAADTATCEAYATVLLAWLQNGSAPQQDIIPAVELEKLLAIDAVVLTDAGLGCYPFSASKTGISVKYDAHTVYAMCAIDALAIPFLAASPATIHTHCSNCEEPIVVRTDETGQVKEEIPAGAQVEYRQISVQHSACCNDLCPGITFVCPTCVANAHLKNDLMSLEEAAVVGRAFFHFQSCLDVCLA